MNSDSVSLDPCKMPNRNICTLENPVSTLDALLREGLASLFQELILAPWYKREQEIVSLFAFGHFVRLFLGQSIDVGQLCIEGRVPQVWAHRRSRRAGSSRAQRDLVIWARRNDGFWRVENLPDRPFAVVEWKLSLSDKTGARKRAEYKDDIDWLRYNASMMRVGYAVLLDRHEGKLRLRCTRVENGEINEKFLVLPLNLFHA